MLLTLVKLVLTISKRDFAGVVIYETFLPLPLVHLNKIIFLSMKTSNYCLFAYSSDGTFFHFYNLPRKNITGANTITASDPREPSFLLGLTAA